MTSANPTSDANAPTPLDWRELIASARYCEAIQRPWRECNLPELELQQTESKEFVDLSGIDPP